jgi:hypothetical protein
VHFFVC